MDPLFDKIPLELRDLRQWVNWKKITRDGKSTKFPCQPNGTPASSTDPSTWCDFSELADSMPRGFVFSGSDDFIGIDLDGCRDPETGKLDPWAREIVLKLGTYAEISPSGTGVKMFATTGTPWQHRNRTDLPGDGYGGKSPGIEIYDVGRYFATTGNRLSGTKEINFVDEQLEWIAEKYDLKHSYAKVDGTNIANESPVLERASKYVAKMDPAISGSNGHGACYKVACALVLGFALTTDEAYHIIASEYNQRCDPPWSEKEIWHKVNSADRQPGQRGYLRDARTSDYSRIHVHTPGADHGAAAEPEQAAESKPVKSERPRKTTLEDATLNYLEQLQKGGQVLIETGIPDLDYALSGGIAPGEMVIIAARPSHGKSAVSLQMVHHMTGNGIPAVIVSEEMSSLAIGKRAIQYITDVPEEHWKTRDSDVMSSLDHHFSGRAEAVIVESCGTLDRVIAEVEREVARIKAGVVVIDYAQLIGVPGKSDYERVTQVSQELRRMSVRLGVTLIMLAQLNREIENRKTFTPQSSDLRSSGQLEQDADVIVFGVWPVKIQPDAEPATYRFYIDKVRNRERKRRLVEVKFEPSRQRMIEAESIAARHAEFDPWN